MARSIDHPITRSLDHPMARFAAARYCAAVTITVMIDVPLFPFLSTAVQVTFVAPTGKLEPGAGLHVTVTVPSTLSFAVTLKFTAAPDDEDAVAVTAPVVVMTGGIVSRARARRSRIGAQSPSAHSLTSTQPMNPSPA